MTEMTDIVDDEDKIIGKATRDETNRAHLLHRSATIIILDEQGRFFVQKRAKTKKLWPGKFAVGVVETVQAGEKYEETAVRGMKEEIGIFGKPQFLFDFKFRSNESNENSRIYRCTIYEEPEFVDGEVEEGYFAEKEELKKMLNEKDFDPYSKSLMESYWRLLK